MSGALLRSAVQLVRVVFGARAASLLLHDAVAGELEIAHVSGEGAAALTGVRIPASRGIAGWVLAARQPIVLEDVASDARFAADVAASSGYAPKGLMAAPILGDGEATLGVIEVFDRPQRSQFSLLELDLLGLFAEHLALAVAAGERADPEPVLVRVAAALARLDAQRRERAEVMLDALADLL
jgi:GAF domain-containing protein